VGHLGDLQAIIIFVDNGQFLFATTIFYNDSVADLIVSTHFDCLSKSDAWLLASYDSKQT